MKKFKALITIAEKTVLGSLAGGCFWHEFEAESLDDAIIFLNQFCSIHKGKYSELTELQ